MSANSSLMLLFLVLISSSTTYASGLADDVRSWCGKTPYPQPCEYFLSNNGKNPLIARKSDFLRVSVELALERAVRAQTHASSLGYECRDARERVAWSDCLELYDHVIHRINQTLEFRCTKEDSQTWLSAALTSLETCRDGFADLGVTDYVLPMMSNNVSKLISNALALNHVPHGRPEHGTRFPSWLKPLERKLIRSSSSPASRANIVVAQDGSGNYKTIQGALIAASKRKGSSRYVIYIKAGTYKENVVVGKSLRNVMFVGDGMGKTVITGSKSVGGGSTTFGSATVAIVGDGFIAHDVTIRNTAGAASHQAVALRSGSDQSVFYRCSIEGYQDTLYIYTNRQFYRECNIYGTVDFVFGNAAAVLQNCTLFARYPPNRTNTVTAQGRTDPNQNTGISIHDCRVVAASDLKPRQSSVNTYLGRPWKQYSRTVFMKTYLDGLINPAGWMEWNGNFALNTLYYGEYMNTGPGSSTRNRVRWAGYRVITSPTEALKFTTGSFIAGKSWLPVTGVPFAAGL